MAIYRRFQALRMPRLVVLLLLLLSLVVLLLLQALGRQPVWGHETWETTTVPEVVSTHPTTTLSTYPTTSQSTTAKPPRFKHAEPDYREATTILKVYNVLMNNDTQPMTADPANFSTLTEWWQAAAMIKWYLTAPVDIPCKKLDWAGNWRICADPKMRVTKPCLVYSFGINYDFSFDDTFAKIECDVRSFDPSMKAVDHERGNYIRFYKIGLAGYNTNSFRATLDRYVKQQQIWQLRTLAYIRRQLAHTERVIDVLKIDIETMEWSTLDNILETGMTRYIRHLLVEFHVFDYYNDYLNGTKHQYFYYLEVMTRLRNTGFLSYKSDPHGESTTKPYNFQCEMLFFNSYFLV